jgi:hypothetical protein
MRDIGAGWRQNRTSGAGFRSIRLLGNIGPMAAAPDGTFHRIRRHLFQIKIMMAINLALTFAARLTMG